MNKGEICYHVRENGNLYADYRGHWMPVAGLTFYPAEISGQQPRLNLTVMGRLDISEEQSGVYDMDEWDDICDRLSDCLEREVESLALDKGNEKEALSELTFDLTKEAADR